MCIYISFYNWYIVTVFLLLWRLLDGGVQPEAANVRADVRNAEHVKLEHANDRVVHVLPELVGACVCVCSLFCCVTTISKKHI